MRLLLHKDKLFEWGITIAVLPIAIQMMFDKEAQFNANIHKYVDETMEDIL